MTIKDLYSLAEEERIGIYAFDLGDIPALAVQHENGDCDIALNMDFVDTTSQETEYIAHEMGHCMTGSFYHRYTPYDIWKRHENKADRWAITHILPFDDMLHAMRSGYTTPWELADYFNVTESMIRKAYAYYTDTCGMTFS